MKGKITLRNPIKIDGKKVKEITYDTEKITIDDYLAAIERGGRTGLSIETDYGAHLQLGFAAVVGANPDIAVEDLQRITGYDLIQFTDVGMLFTRGREDQMVKPSEETSEPTQDDTPSALMKSDEEDSKSS